jgi:outer membrane protein OmpA-like peptidoglycan-associated protein
MERSASLLIVAALALTLAGCASKPPAPLPVNTSKTTVILLPDEDGHVGEVSVASAEGSQKVDTAYSFTTVTGAFGAPSAAESMGVERVNATFSAVIRAQPPKPQSFTLHFLLDSTILTEESKAQLPALFEAVRRRKPTEISIFGHTDAIGTEAHNVKLSAARAQVVEGLLRNRDPDLGHIDVKFFGSKEPLFPSAPRAAEPRNRRAEIMVL